MLTLPTLPHSGTRLYDAALSNISGNVAVYVVVDKAAPGWNPCAPVRACWPLEIPLVSQDPDFDDREIRIAFRRVRVRDRIGNAIGGLLRSIHHLAPHWSVVEDEPKDDIVLSWVEITVLMDDVRRIPLDCGDWIGPAPRLLSELAKGGTR